jgi:hypothetical protein
MAFIQVPDVDSDTCASPVSFLSTPKSVIASNNSPVALTVVKNDIEMAPGDGAAFVTGSQRGSQLHLRLYGLILPAIAMRVGEAVTRG